MIIASTTPSTAAEQLLTVQLLTADDCRGTFTVGVFAGERHQSAVKWAPRYPMLGTTEVILQRTATSVPATEQSITGDAWRELESQDLEDEFLDRVLHGADALQVSADLLDGHSAGVNTNIRLRRVSSEHGFDDFNVSGHPLVHRVTVGHGIRKGEPFNVYCADSRKVGGTWAGNLESSLAAVFQTLAAEWTSG